MSDHAVETLWKIAFALVNIVLLPLLYLLLKPLIEDLVERWKYRRTKAIRLTGQWHDKDGYVYNMTALLYLEPCEHKEGDHNVKGLIESKLIEYPSTFAEKYPKYPHGSIAFEIVTGYFDKNLVLHLTTEAITDRILLSPCTYVINISKDRNNFNGTSTQIGTGSQGSWKGSAYVR